MATITSLASIAVAASFASREWWLKDPLDASRNMTFDVVGDRVTQSATEERATYKPLGRKNVVIISDVIHGEHFELTLEFLTDTAYNRFETLYKSQRTLLLQRGFTNEQWWIRLGQVRTLTILNFTPPIRQVKIDAEEVDAPPGISTALFVLDSSYLDQQVLA
jgi:hypothetical protein